MALSGPVRVLMVPPCVLGRFVFALPLLLDGKLSRVVGRGPDLKWTSLSQQVEQCLHGGNLCQCPRVARGPWVPPGQEVARQAECGAAEPPSGGVGGLSSLLAPSCCLVVPLRPCGDASVSVCFHSCHNSSCSPTLTSGNTYSHVAPCLALSRPSASLSRVRCKLLNGTRRTWSLRLRGLCAHSSSQSSLLVPLAS